MHAMQEETGAPLTASKPPPLPDSASGPARRDLYAVVGAVAGVTLLADQGSKWWALRTLAPGETQELVGHWITLHLIRNAGAAFSLGDGATWLLTVISLGILGWVLSAVRRVGHRGWALALGLLLGGAVGNLVDRFFRAPGPGQGHVVDFIDYFGFFVGNVADIAIVVAAGLVMLLALRGVEISGRSAREGVSDD